MNSLLELAVYRKLATPLTRPNHVASWGQLARMARVGDDRARRSLSKLTAHFSTDLIVSKDRRLVLTGAGKKLLQVADQLTTLSEDAEEEVLTVQIEPLLAQSLLPQALPDFFEVWSYVQLRVCPLDSGSVRQHIAEGGVTAFGVGIA
jgi:DNA-binding transcriptional LysR family regulator